MTDKELFDIAERVKQQATTEELEEFKHLERREERVTWVKNQTAKLDKGDILP